MKRSYDNQCIVAGVAAAVAGINDSEEKPPAYLKLIADCWEHIFDYLSFRDILQMGQTCKRMNRMAGYYIREYYPQLEFHLGGKIICSLDRFGKSVCLQTEFYPFIGQLKILNVDNNALKLLSNANTFDALKTIIFKTSCEFSETQIESMSKALKNVENIEIENCEIVGNFYERLANFYPKLKQIEVSNNLTGDALFFLQHYPLLECLRYYKMEFSRIVELKTFLEKHSKLKQFHIEFEFFYANRNILFQTNIQLDLLNVRFNRLNRHTPFDEFIEFLKSLHDRNFYKTVQLSFFSRIDAIDRDRISHAISSLPRLEKLHILTDSHLNLSSFTNLKELQIFEFDRATNIETLAKSFPKLEQLVVYKANIETILPFLRHTKNLKAIKLYHLSVSGLDLSALNNERKKLENACQVSIYMRDNDYLYPKWKSHNFKLELDLVKIVRLESLPNIYS